MLTRSRPASYAKDMHAARLTRLQISTSSDDSVIRYGHRHGRATVDRPRPASGTGRERDHQGQPEEDSARDARWGKGPITARDLVIS